MPAPQAIGQIVVAAETPLGQRAELRAQPWPLAATLRVDAPRLVVPSYAISAAAAAAVSVALRSTALRSLAPYACSCWRALVEVCVATGHPFVVGSAAFLGCTRLEAVRLDGCLVLGNLCFANCRALTSARITPPRGAKTVVGRACFLNTPLEHQC